MTTAEILAVLDTMDASVNAFRKLNDYASTDKKWSVAIKCERHGVGVEVKPCFGATFNAALISAFSKFEPAAAGGLPTLAIVDASFTEVDKQEYPF